jgi:hypothetical protein
MWPSMQQVNWKRLREAATQREQPINETMRMHGFSCTPVIEMR